MRGAWIGLLLIFAIPILLVLDVLFGWWVGEVLLRQGLGWTMEGAAMVGMAAAVGAAGGQVIGVVEGFNK